MVDKKFYVGVSIAILLSAVALFVLPSKVMNLQQEKAINEQKMAQKNENKQEKKVIKNNLYSNSLYDLPLYSVVDISKLPSNLRVQINKLLEESQGFYLLKYNEDLGRVFIILQNPVTITNTFQRQGVECVEFIINQDKTFSRNNYFLGENGNDGEIYNVLEGLDIPNEIWELDDSLEPKRPLKRTVYNEKGKIDYIETWNYSEDDVVKYRQKRNRGKVLSILKEMTEGDTGLRREHIIYSPDGEMETLLSVSFEGSDITRMIHYNSQNFDDSISIVAKYENGLRVEETIYDKDYKIINIVKTEYLNNERQYIKVFNDTGDLIYNLPLTVHIN